VLKNLMETGGRRWPSSVELHSIIHLRLRKAKNYYLYCIYFYKDEFFKALVIAVINGKKS
jgi:hypothetical protein